MIKKIFVTGSAGFIGFSLAKFLLDNGYHVHGYDCMSDYYDAKLKHARHKILKGYKNFSFTENMLENQEVLDKAITNFKPEIIVHLAAQAGVRYSIEQPRVYLSSNITGTFNIIELAHKLKVNHLIISSSSSVYGANKNMPYHETDKAQTQLSIYAATKKATESIAHSYSNIWKLPITMLRFFTVYGPWGRPDMALFKFTKNILKEKTIEVYNYGNHTRDFTYIDDIVEAVISILDKPAESIERPLTTKDYPTHLSSAPWRVYNIGNNIPVDLMGYIDAIEKALGKTAEKEFHPLQPGDVKESLAKVKSPKSQFHSFTEDQKVFDISTK